MAFFSYFFKSCNPALIPSHLTMDYYEQVKEAADAVRRRIGEVPSIGIVLGSGLGGFVESLDEAVSMAYEELPHWPVSRVPGHEGRLVVGKMHGRRLIALAGRCHVYEGHSLQTVTFAVRVLGLLGIRVLILTNAAGGIHTGFDPGALMVIDDHVNLMGSNPLVGPNDDRFGPRFPDMSQVYSARLRRIADLAGGRPRSRWCMASMPPLPGPVMKHPPKSDTYGRSG